ncbi:pyrimidine-specific ribonucleoside hydrolase rihB, partial [Trifolium medium]|nr:pyrimidine-specific ribonucleoside hydrolase rihB [Trifolium medium]
DTFLGEILGAVVMADKASSLKPKFEKKPIKVLASGDESTDGKMVVDEKHGNQLR